MTALLADGCQDRHTGGPGCQWATGADEIVPANGCGFPGCERQTTDPAAAAGRGWFVIATRHNRWFVICPIHNNARRTA